MRLAQLSLILAFLFVQSGCQLVAMWPRSTQSRSNRNSQQTTQKKSSTPAAKPETPSNKRTFTGRLLEITRFVRRRRRNSRFGLFG
jgi:hypothetical protein